jgi:hypothetical protein
VLPSIDIALRVRGAISALAAVVVHGTASLVGSCAQDRPPDGPQGAHRLRGQASGSRIASAPRRREAAARCRSCPTTFAGKPIAIPPLSDREAKLAPVVEEYIDDATTELRVARTSFPSEDRDWVFKHASASLPEIEKATLRLLALREAGGNMNRAAARLGMGRWSLSKWVNRRQLPVHVVDVDE